MATVPDGGPAFPSVESGEEWSDMKCEYVMRTYAAGGMSLRDYFAAKALVGLLGYVSSDDWNDGYLKSGAVQIYARSAYRVADAMLKAREAT